MSDSEKKDPPSKEVATDNQLSASTIPEDLAKVLNEKGGNEALITYFAKTSISHHAHPIPPPDMLREYLEMNPEWAEEFFTQWKASSEVQRFRDKNESQRKTLQLWLSAVITSIAIGCAFVAGVLGYTITAGLLGIVASVTGVTTAVKLFSGK